MSVKLSNLFLLELIVIMKASIILFLTCYLAVASGIRNFCYTIQNDFGKYLENFFTKFHMIFLAKWFDSYAHRDHRIIGGVEADKHEFPSILNMGYHSCAATLIHAKWALTAAHCIPINQVVGGDHLISRNDGTEQRVRVKRNIRHPSYGSPGRFSNDVALLELEEAFELNEYVQTVKLAPRGFRPTGNSISIL